MTMVQMKTTFCGNLKIVKSFENVSFKIEFLDVIRERYSALNGNIFYIKSVIDHSCF